MSNRIFLNLINPMRFYGGLRCFHSDLLNHKAWIPSQPHRVPFSLFGHQKIGGRVSAPIFSPQRYFATDSEVLKNFQKMQIKRTSLYEPQANELITAIQNREYHKAEILVRQNKVNVDGHNWTENTPLTDAAARGDSQGIAFLIQKLGANPHASCDCPHHKTALHYASENGHVDAVKTLIQFGARPNVLDSRGKTPLMLSNNPEVQKVLSQREPRFPLKPLLSDQ